MLGIILSHSNGLILLSWIRIGCLVPMCPRLIFPSHLSHHTYNIRHGKEMGHKERRGHIIQFHETHHNMKEITTLVQMWMSP